MAEKEKHPAAPELLRELETASGDVAAMFALRKDVGVSERFARVHDLVLDLVARAERMTGTTSRDLAVYEALGAFALRAPSRFVRALLDQPEILSAAPERGHDTAYIPPVITQFPGSKPAEQPRKKK